MKILKSKTYRKLMDQNKLLSLNVSQAATNLTSSIRLIEVQKVKIDQLEKERLYVNFTRDSKGRLHAIRVKEKPVPKKEIEVASTLKDFAKKFLGKEIRCSRGAGKICGYSDDNVLLGLDNKTGHQCTITKATIIKKYTSYWFVTQSDVLSQLNKK